MKSNKRERELERVSVRTNEKITKILKGIKLQKVQDARDAVENANAELSVIMAGLKHKGQRIITEKIKMELKAIAPPEFAEEIDTIVCFQFPAPISVYDTSYYKIKFKNGDYISSPHGYTHFSLYLGGGLIRLTYDTGKHKFKALSVQAKAARPYNTKKKRAFFKWLLWDARINEMSPVTYGKDMQVELNKDPERFIVNEKLHQ